MGADSGFGAASWQGGDGIIKKGWERKNRGGRWICTGKWWAGFASATGSVFPEMWLPQALLMLTAYVPAQTIVTNTGNYAAES